jgi:ribosomal protein L37AE/L43A
MPHLVEQHTQLSINTLRSTLYKINSLIFTRNGEIYQDLETRPCGNDLIICWTSRTNKARQYQIVGIRETKTNFEGKRKWFVCPNCNRNCASLFDYGSTWWCRKCGNLKYTTASRSKKDRPFSRIETLKRKVEIDYHTPLEILEDWEKPPRMRWKTWLAVKDEHNQLVSDLARQIKPLWISDNSRKSQYSPL